MSVKDTGAADDDDDDDDSEDKPKDVHRELDAISKAVSKDDYEAIDRNSSYQIRPTLVDKFKSMSVKEMIHIILNEELGGKTYAMEESETWTKSIVTSVKESVKELGFKRYKIIVQTVLGQNKGSGVKVGARCLWDADTDNYASDYFLNDTMFCCVAVFGIYCY